MEKQKDRGNLGGNMSKTAVNGTKEQQQVIESRGCHLLVSAAAGSGKTAVLVERIIRMVTEGENPLDIDRLLVMTFTNAAAAEMRERIGEAIEARLLEDPHNQHLQVQSALVHHAKITTIDSFCLNIIREHFNLLDLDPSFRIGDEGEMLLLRADVMAELIEDAYQEGSERFIRFVEAFGQGKSDAGIEDYIMQVYQYAQSNPYPEQWLEQCRKELSEEEKPSLTWISFLMEDVKKQLKELAVQERECLELCQEDDCFQAYIPMMSSDVCQLEAAAGAEDFEMLYEKLSAISWQRLATVRSKEADPEKKAYLTGCRDRVKKAVGKMKELYCFASPEEMFTDMKKTGEAIEVLLDLAEDFDRRFQEKKRDRNLVDFNDLEHQALKVLIRWEEGRMVYTEAADELSSQFEEVLVDEYQDSNLVQEALLQAVSRERFGQYNVFMVGDVKQSIYKFRLARPELFLEKYNTYEPYEAGLGKKKKIELHQNFRSREQVLSGVNDVFFRIMTENLGNIRYTEEAALHPGAVFQSVPSEEEGEEASTSPTFLLRAGLPRLLVTDTGQGALDQMEEEAADYTAREIEGKMIAAEIRAMTDPEKGMAVWDKKLDRYRTAQYRDMVILLRSTTGWTETFLSVLLNEGIPAYAESRTGYFTTVEVETVLSMLSVIDNPMQDIPLAAALKSPMGGMTDEELARLMGWYKRLLPKGQDRGIYGAVRAWTELAESDKDELTQKLIRFQQLVQKLRRQSVYLPIHELIYQVYEDTGYYRMVSAMAAGETRRANLDMLVEKAVEYENTSYKGLFHFIRYIENLKKYHSDFGEASVVGEEENTVRIMSIHKSKGLEFPVVFLAGMGKKFNRQDTYSRLLIDPELGIATDYLDLEKRLKSATLKKNVLRRKMELDNLGEELRVLYVAMTRAKEQLIMTGTDRGLEKKLEKYRTVPEADGQIPYTVLAGAGSYLDWLLMSLGSTGVRILMEEIPLQQIVGEELKRQVKTRASREFLKTLDPETVYEKEWREMLEKHLSYQYPYEADILLHTKMSVSELKKQGQLTDESESVQTEALEERKEDEEEPKTAGTKRRGKGGAVKGTAYHRAMELLPLDRINSRFEAEACLKQLVEEKRYTKENRSLIDSRVIWRFLQSPLGKRMSRALAEGRLHREQQFIIGIPAREMGAGDSDELVLIQGIIDAYFEEQDGLVLMDYKTDRVDNEEILIQHYQEQLDYYGRALTQMTGKPVKERLIYSFALNREIPVPLSAKTEPER